MDREEAVRVRQRPNEGNWEHIRRVALTGERAPEWPDEVQGISINGLNLLGIHEKTRELYWDGKPIAMRPGVKLGAFERVLAALAALGAFGTFVVELGRSAKWWM